MILVIGGKGKTGRRVVDRLAAAGVEYRSVSRTTEIPFDWNDESTWGDAVAGVDAAYITYHPDLAFPGAAASVARLAGRAREAGVQRLVLLSGRGEEGAEAGERAVQESGLAWTVVRCNWFNQNFDESFLLQSVRDGVIAIPAGDAVEPFVDADDIADVVAAALLGERHMWRVYTLSGPRLLGFADVAAELSRATGRTITYQPVSPEEYSRMLEAEGLPPEFAELFTLILDGRNASVTDGVRRALGRDPKDFATYAAEVARTGVWDAGAPSTGVGGAQDG